MAVNIKKIGSEELEKQKNIAKRFRHCLKRDIKIRTSRLPVS